MLSDPTVVAACVAAIVSIFVAILGYIINYVTLHQSQKQFEQQLQRNLTEKLYNKRLEVYPLVFSITDQLRGQLIFNNNIKVNDFIKIRDEINDWNKNHGFVLSDNGIKAFYALRRALSIEHVRNGEISKKDLELIFKAKNEFRSCLRNDVNLLYVEERDE